ncbi:MAG: hypothetical protein QNL64_07275 [Porticoccus sp.]
MINNNWNNRIKFYFILLLLSGLNPLVFAKDEQSVQMLDAPALKSQSSEIAISKGPNLESKQKVTPSSTANKKILDREFNPSEEISEDLPIPFPVDI